MQESNQIIIPPTGATEKKGVMVPMKKAIKAFTKFVIFTIILTVIISSIAVKAISALTAENVALREQLAEMEEQVLKPHTMSCNLHIDLLPSWNIDFLCHNFPMTFQTTWDYCSAYAEGEIVPMLEFEGNYFIEIYVTA